MTPAQYRKLTDDVIRRTRPRVRTTTELGNQIGVIPRGTLATITGKHGGLQIETAACGECGLRLRITKVDARDVELAP